MDFATILLYSGLVFFVFIFLRIIFRTLRKRIKRLQSASIRHMNSMMEDTPKNDICPRCGSRLIIRRGTYGKILECGNFPKCRFRKKLL